MTFYDTKESQQYYYEHSYSSFDHLCENDNERIDCVNMYISKGISTSDFEAVKYIIFNKDLLVMYIIDKYSVQDWNHIFATAIISRSSISLLLFLVMAYEKKTNNKFKVNPEETDFLYLALSCNNIDALNVIIKTGDMTESTRKLFVSAYSSRSFEELSEQCYKWNINNSSNPRNLVYALCRYNITLALELIENGSIVDCWNNYPMILCCKDQNLKRNTILMKALFERGAHIPKYALSVLKETNKNVFFHM